MNGVLGFRALVMALSMVALPGLGAAQNSPEFENEVTFGLRLQSAQPALYDRYLGISNDHLSGGGSLHVNKSEAWDSGKTGYFRAEAEGLDFGRHQMFPDADAAVSAGQQGQWGMKADFQATSTRGR